MRKRNILYIFIGTALILSIPLIAMQFSEEWDWKPFDFVIIGTLLIGSGLLYELIAVRIKPQHRPILAALAVAGVMLVWAELAVGAIEQMLTLF